MSDECQKSERIAMNAADNKEIAWWLNTWYLRADIKNFVVTTKRMTIEETFTVDEERIENF